MGRKAQNHVVSLNYWTLVEWWEASGLGGRGQGTGPQCRLNQAMLTLPGILRGTLSFNLSTA